MTFAVEGDVVLEGLAFRILRVGADAVEAAVEIVGDVAVHLAVEQRVLAAIHRGVGGGATGAELAPLPGKVTSALAGAAAMAPTAAPSAAAP